MKFKIRIACGFIRVDGLHADNQPSTYNESKTMYITLINHLKVIWRKFGSGKKTFLPIFPLIIPLKPPKHPKLLK